jgi:hypothetical protein
MENKLYHVADDPYFASPYIDTEDIREGVEPYRYVHGGFRGTNTRFSFFFPVNASDYKGRFFHFVAPMQGSEDASIERIGCGIADKITFALTHGAYFVETNMGVDIVFGALPDPQMIFKASAACAEYSRVAALRLFGGDRPNGYIYGGSGGGFKSTSCFENTDAWDGAVPYIIGSPHAIPNMFTVRALAKRVLRHKLPLIADALEAGGSGEPYAGLNDEEAAILKEAGQMGFPPKVWMLHKSLDDGALPVLRPAVERMDPAYYSDFWQKPGYAGFDPASSASKDRICHEAAIKEIYIPDELEVRVPFEGAPRKVAPKLRYDGRTGADDSWKRLATDLGLSGKPALRLSSVPTGDLYTPGTSIKFKDGKAAGYEVPLNKFEGDWVVIDEGFGLLDMLDRLSEAEVGDTVILDNSDYIALQYYHRHQLPREGGFAGFEQFADGEGKPLYPQREMLAGPIITYGGAGSLQSGKFKGKMINVCALMDESALPWQADWYRKKVAENLGSSIDERHRLYYIENALHDDGPHAADEARLVRYIGALHQALLDLSDWVEKGVAPPAGTVYSVRQAQMQVPQKASERKGLQATLQLFANENKRTEISPGTEVIFKADIQVPERGGIITSAKMLFTDGAKWQDVTLTSEDGVNYTARSTYTYDSEGTYYPVLHITTERAGNKEDIFTQIENLDRVRVVVRS